MSKPYTSDYSFKNESLSHKSYIDCFTKKTYEEFDSELEKINFRSKINDLFDGKTVNKTECQAAFHPRYRDEYTDESIIKYFDLFQSAKNIVTIGIGGSFEGPKLLIESFGNTLANYIFITGSDLSEFNDKIANLDSSDTIFIVSSKSFKTDEIILILKKAIAWSGNLDNFLAITANKEEVSKYKIKNIIEFDKEIGGRYSIWSDISLIAEWENKKKLKTQFMKGGKKADIDLLTDNDYLRFVKHLSFSDIWLHNYMQKSVRVVLSYIWRLRSFPDYVQQLEMESLGKQCNKDSKFKKTGQIIFGGYGPTAQHSYFQLLHQGTQEVCADIIASNEDINSLDYAQAITQSKLLSYGAHDLLGRKEVINGNVPVNLILLNKLDSYTLGYLIATWEHRTFITALMLGINPYDQFGVNAGKIYTKKYLENKN